jgi:hypothetical protein
VKEKRNEDGGMPEVGSQKSEIRSLRFRLSKRRAQISSRSEADFRLLISDFWFLDAQHP